MKKYIYLNNHYFLEKIIFNVDYLIKTIINFNYNLYLNYSVASIKPSRTASGTSLPPNASKD